MCKPFSDNPAHVRAFLDAHLVPYDCLRHAPANTMEDCKAIEARLGCTIPKNLFLRTTNGSVRFLLMLAPDRRFVTSEISKQLGVSRLSFASQTELERLLHTSPGSLSITGLIFDESKTVRLAMDSALLALPALGCHASLNTETLRIPTAALLERFLPALGVKPEII